MTPYTPTDTFHPTIDTFEISDPVLGGSAGESNIPVKQIADNLIYLFNRLGRFDGIRTIVATGNITVADVFKLMSIVTTGNITLTIADVADFPVGAIIPFKCSCPASKAVTVVTTSGQLIKDGSLSGTTQWLCDGEELKLVAAGDHWMLMDPKGNFGKVGTDDIKRIQPRNTLIADGCQPEVGGSLYLRADHPRLWSAVEAIAIDDAIWLGDPILNRAFFSSGNGSTTFRVPDMRAMFIRGLDLGRGISINRFGSTVGCYEPDLFKLHNHPINTTDSGLSSEDGADPMRGSIPGTENTRGGSGTGSNKTIKAVGGTETTPKNIGMLPVIYY